jgi:hypothetical protein
MSLNFPVAATTASAILFFYGGGGSCPTLSTTVYQISLPAEQTTLHFMAGQS